MIVAILLIVTFLPALLVFGFVKIFKKQLAANPTKKQMYTYIVIYLIAAILLFGLLILVSNMAHY
jgi:uncharacterized Rmd1/YagE family protein